MDIKKLLKLLLTTTTPAFWIGFITNYSALKEALATIRANGYLGQGLTSLAAGHLRPPLVQWFSLLFFALLLTLTLWFLWQFLFKRFVTLQFSFQVEHKEKIKKAVAAVFSLIFLFYGELLVNGNLATARFSMLNVLLNVLVLLMTVGLWSLLTKSKWEKVFQVVNFKNLARITLVPIALLLLINVILVFKPFTAAPRGVNVILVVVDCLRADHLGCYGYQRDTSPHIDALATESTVFQNHYSNASWTKPAVASLFTSLYPNQHGALSASDTLADQLPTLAEILKNGGYHTWFFNGGNPVVGDKFNFYQGFTPFESINRAGVLTDQFLQQLGAWHQKKDKRFFAYLHYMDLHLPFHKNKYNTYFQNNIANPFLAPGYINRVVIRNALAEGKFTQQDRRDLMALYDGQIKYIDDALGKLAGALKTHNLHKNTVIIFTADHGEELWDHGNFEHGHSLYNELLHVPLFIWGKGFKPTNLQTPVSLVDLLPTILDLTRIRAGKLDFQGNSILKLKEKPVFATGTLYNDQKYCIIQDGLKLIVNTGVPVKPLIGAASSKKHELYDLLEDPGERQALDRLLPKKLAALKETLKKYIALTGKLVNKKVSLDQDKELKEKLKSLGYL